MNEYAGTPTSETLPQSKAYAERALAIDGQLAEPHATLGSVNEYLGQLAEAEKEFKQAIELNPNYATAYHWYSIFLKDVGRNDEAAAMIKRAQELDPLSSVIGVNVSRMYQLQNNHEASIQNSLKIIELDPNFGPAHEYLGLSYLRLGRNADAIASSEKAVQLTNRAAITLGDLGYVYSVTGKRAEAGNVIKELEAKYARKEAIGQYIAAVYTGLGDNDKALLRQSFRKGRRPRSRCRNGGQRGPSSNLLVWASSEADPLSPVISFNIGFQLFLARRYDDAIREFDHTANLHPDFALGRRVHAGATMQKGRLIRQFLSAERPVN